MARHSLYLAVGLPAGFQVITDSRAAPHRFFHAEHAVLIAAGMQITQFASFPQSIIHHYWNSR